MVKKKSKLRENVLRKFTPPPKVRQDHGNPTNVARAHLVTGCPNARAAVRIERGREKIRNPWRNLEKPRFRLPLVRKWRSRWCGSSGTSIGWALSPPHPPPLKGNERK